MIYDVVTVAQKELKEILLQRGSLRGGLMNLLIILAITGILFPLDNGPSWLTSPLSLITMIWMPLLMSMGLIADSFAGERERHTLETLLATRLSDRAILFGKIGASITYAVGLTLAGALLGAVTINVQYPGAGFYSPSLLAGMLVFGLLGSLLISASRPAPAAAAWIRFRPFSHCMIWIWVSCGKKRGPKASGSTSAR